MRKELVDLALERKDELSRSACLLERQIAETTAKLHALKAEASELPQKLKRVDSYRHEKGKICPHCFVNVGKRIELTSMSSETNEDNFKCKTCGFEISLSP